MLLFHHLNKAKKEINKYVHNIKFKTTLYQKKHSLNISHHRLSKDRRLKNESLEILRSV